MHWSHWTSAGSAPWAPQGSSGVALVSRNRGRLRPGPPTSARLTSAPGEKAHSCERLETKREGLSREDKDDPRRRKRTWQLRMTGDRGGRVGLHGAGPLPPGNGLQPLPSAKLSSLRGRGSVSSTPLIGIHRPHSRPSILKKTAPGLKGIQPAREFREFQRSSSAPLPAQEGLRIRRPFPKTVFRTCSTLLGSRQLCEDCASPQECARPTFCSLKLGVLGATGSVPWAPEGRNLPPGPLGSSQFTEIVIG